jgi:chorismate dehydratase
MDACDGGLRCGRISYTNDLPIYAAFDAGAVRFPGTFVSGVPAVLNRMMLAGELDCGPISSFFYAQHASDFVLLPDVCIGSRREVRSIYCMSRVAPSRLSGEPINVTNESATGRALFDVICRTRHGFAPTFVGSDDPLRAYRERGAPCVVIGDAAIDAFLGDPEHAYDLGTLWHSFTSEDMVYAVWAVRRDVAERAPSAAAAVAESMRESLEWGLRNIGVAIAQAQKTIARPPEFYAGYFAALNYRFDRSARRGLRAFFSACAASGVLAAAPAPAFLSGELARV